MNITIPELLQKIANAKTKDLLIHHFLLSISALFSLKTLKERQAVMDLVKWKLANFEKREKMSKLVIGN